MDQTPFLTPLKAMNTSIQDTTGVPGTQSNLLSCRVYSFGTVQVLRRCLDLGSETRRTREMATKVTESINTTERVFCQALDLVEDALELQRHVHQIQQNQLVQHEQFNKSLCQITTSLDTDLARVQALHEFLLANIESVKSANQKSAKDNLLLQQKIEALQIQLRRAQQAKKQLQTKFQELAKTQRTLAIQQTVLYNMLMILREQILTLNNTASRKYVYNQQHSKQKHRKSLPFLPGVSIYHTILLDITYFLLTETNLKSFNLLRLMAFNSAVLTKAYPHDLLISVINTALTNYEIDSNEGQARQEVKKSISIHIDQNLVCLVFEAVKIILAHFPNRLKLHHISQKHLILANPDNQLILLNINPWVPSLRSLIIQA